jgi:hypothetical protein
VRQNDGIFLQSQTPSKELFNFFLFYFAGKVESGESGESGESLRK